ncbi:MAG TPA: methyltransferase domain-containing protein [Thermoplasmata archaeon]
MDQKVRDAFADRVYEEVNGAMSVLTMYVGERLGLFRALESTGPVTADGLALRLQLNERYVREWLGCMAVNGYIDHDHTNGTFRLSPEHADVLTNPESPAYAMPYVRYVPSFSSTLAALVTAFRTGGGVAFEAYGPDLVSAIGEGNRPFLLHDLVSKWIPAMPDVESRLRQGGRVADVGCGEGWLSILLAQAFPRVQCDAVEPDARSIASARENALQAGVGDRIRFHGSPLETADIAGPFDLIAAVECIHDLVRPVSVLRRMRSLLDPGGAVLIVDEAGGETIDENRTLAGRILYNFSVLHCLPQAMTEPGSAATGAVMSVSTFQRYARDAGFTRVDVLPIANPLWRFYRLG